MRYMQSYKAPTCVLLNEKDNMVSFGYEAEELFVDEDDEDGEQGPKYFLENFKMVLHGQRKYTFEAISLVRVIFVYVEI